MIGFFLLACTSVSIDWEAHAQAGLAAHASGDWKRAQAELESAWSFAECLPQNDARRARIAHNLGSILHLRGNFDRAEDLFHQALPVAVDSLERGKLLNNVAVLYRAQGRFESAEEAGRRAIGLLELAGNAEAVLPMAHYNLAEIYRHLHRLEEARRELEAAREGIARAGLGERDLAMVLQSEAALWLEFGDIEKADQLQSQAVELIERSLGASHPMLAGGWSNLAMLRARQQRYIEAEQMARRAIAIYETALGDSHPHLATAVNNLAQILRYHGRLLEVEPLLRRAVNIWSRSLGPHHLDTARGMKNLGDFFASRGKSKGAEQWYRRALDSAAKQPEAGKSLMASALEGLSEVYRMENRRTEWIRVRKQMEMGKALR